MSSNAESHSQVIKVVEKPHYSMATVGAANSTEEAIEAFLFGPDYIMGWWKMLRRRDSHVMATRILLKFSLQSMSFFGGDIYKTRKLFLF